MENSPGGPLKCNQFRVYNVDVVYYHSDLSKESNMTNSPIVDEKRLPTLRNFQKCTDTGTWIKLAGQILRILASYEAKTAKIQQLLGILVHNSVNIPSL